MKKLLTIITKVDKPAFIENLAEQLAYAHADMGFGANKQTGAWQPIETSTTDIYVGGTVELILENEQLNIPYITNFLFTCLKGKDGIYKLEWSSSLS
jgi:hypothetical protein